MLIIATGLIVASGACSQPAATSPASGDPKTSVTTTTASPAPAPGGRVELLPAKFIKSGHVAAANTEVSEIMSAAQTYFNERGLLPATSNDLASGYIHTTLKANYFFNLAGDRITRVESVSGGWSNIVFSLGEQKWREGSPDNNHPNDIDIP